MKQTAQTALRRPVSVTKTIKNVVNQEDPDMLLRDELFNEFASKSVEGLYESHGLRTLFEIPV